MATNPFDPYAQEAQAEAAPFNRQREMARILQQQSFQQPQGQLVSGRYVAPSFFQYLTPLVQGYASKRLSEKADQEQLAQAAALRAQSAKDLTRAQQVAKGQEAILSQQGPTPEGGNLSETTGQQAVAANPQLAAQELLKSRDPTLRALGLDYLKGEKLGEGEIKTSGIFGTQTGPRKERQYDLGNKILVVGSDGQERYLPKELAPGEAARFADETGGFTGYGAPNLPQGANIGGALPASMHYQFNPLLSNKQNREAAGKHEAGLAAFVSSAKEVAPAIDKAAALISSGIPTGSFIGNVIDKGFSAVGKSTPSSQAAAKLDVLGAQLVRTVPRFEGSQSNADVQSYEKAAGQVNDRNAPLADRYAALKEVAAIHKKYDPGNPVWKKIIPESYVDQNNPLLQGGGALPVPR